MIWTVILVEMAVCLVLFTAMVILPARKDPVAGIHNYPPEIQEKYFKTHPRIETAPLSKRTVFIKTIGILLFAAVLTGMALLAGADSFGDGFLFAKLKLFRLPGTEHMDKAYAQKWFHVKGMLFPGSLFALILGLLVGGAVELIR